MENAGNNGNPGNRGNVKKSEAYRKTKNDLMNGGKTAAK